MRILTDEEIDEIAAEYSDEFGHIEPDNWVPFARELERRMQEPNDD